MNVFGGVPQTLNIGCTTKCGFYYRLALRIIANRHGQRINILDLSREPHVDWANLHGIIIPGGADIDPQYYLGAVEQDLQEYTKGLDHLVNYSSEGARRDPFEYGILKEYFSREDLKHIPILGICRGMQMLAVSQGIPLYVDIKTELGIRNRRYLFDRIFLDEKSHSLMTELFSHSFRGYKYHHQGIRVDYFRRNSSRWPGVSVTSYSNRGRIAESLEFKDRPILGVQFHPEIDFGFERHSVFGWFLDQAEEYVSNQFLHSNLQRSDATFK